MRERARGLVLQLRSVLAAPRERIFQALTTPADLAAWWGPEGFSTTEMDLDLHVGGRYRFTMQPPEGDAFHLAGEFLEIDAPSRLVCSFRWEEPDPDDRTTTVTLSLRDLGEATECRGRNKPPPLACLRSRSVPGVGPGRRCIGRDRTPKR